MSRARRHPLALTVSVGALTAAVIVGILGLHLKVQRAQAELEHRARALADVERLATISRTRVAAARAYYLSLDPAALQARDQARRQLDQAVGTLRARLTDPAARELLAAVDETELALAGASERLVRAVADGDMEIGSVAARWRAEVRPASDRAEAATMRLVEHERAAFDRASAHFYAVNARAFSGAAAVGALGLVLILALLWLAHRRATQVQEVAEQYRRLVAGAVDYAIYRLDPQGRVAAWNYGAERMKGWRADEIIGKHFSVLFPPEARAQEVPARELAAAREHGHIQDEGWRLRKDGTRFYAQVSLACVRAPGGEVQGFWKITRDVTVHRDLVQQLEDALRTREELIQIASHDLRGPLTAMQVQVDAALRRLRRGTLDLTAEAVLGLLQRLSGGITRTGELLDYLLDLSQAAPEGKVPLRLGTVDLSEVTRAVCERFREQFAAVGASLSVRADAPTPGHWDRFRLEQVLVNLLSNALKYGRGRPVDVTVAPHGPERARLVVRDRGEGIPEEALGRIFKRFQRVTTDPHQPGLGLGLWIVRRVVDSLGGRVWVDSMVGEGAVFTVELPVVGPAASTDADVPRGNGEDHAAH